MSDLVAVRYFKWPERAATSYKGSDMQLLGRDDFGTWLWSPPARRDKPEVDSFMTLVPVDQWWTATWIRYGGRETKLWFDVTTPAAWQSPHLVTMVDLEIDVECLPDGTIEVLDEEEFAQRVAEWNYPVEFVAAAPAAATSILGSIRNRQEPFGRVAAHWLSVATQG